MYNIPTFNLFVLAYLAERNCQINHIINNINSVVKEFNIHIGYNDAADFTSIYEDFRKMSRFCLCCFILDHNIIQPILLQQS